MEDVGEISRRRWALVLSAEERWWMNLSLPPHSFSPANSSSVILHTFLVVSGRWAVWSESSVCWITQLRTPTRPNPVKSSSLIHKPTGNQVFLKSLSTNHYYHEENLNFDPSSMQTSTYLWCRALTTWRQTEFTSPRWARQKKPAIRRGKSSQRWSFWSPSCKSWWRFTSEEYFKILFNGCYFLSNLDLFQSGTC